MSTPHTNSQNSSLPSTLKTPLSPTFRALLNLTPDRYTKSFLKRLFSLASYLDLDPEDICDETLERLEEAAISADITRPRQVPRDAANSWNKMRDLYPQWPRQKLTPPEHRKFITIKFDEMPGVFQEDVAQFFNTDAEVDIFEAPTRQIKSPVTIKDARNKIMQLVTRAVELNVPLKSINRLEDLCAMRIAGPVLEKLYEDADQKPHAHSYRLAKLFVRIAKSASKPDLETILLLEEAERKFRVKDKGISTKMWARLRLLLDDENLGQILTLPWDVVAELDQSAPKISEAWIVQSALIVSLLLAAPIREAILASLDIEKHIKKENKHPYRLIIPKEETANGRALDYAIQGTTLKILKLYLKIYRPLLAPKTNTSLFVSRTGRQKLASELSSQILKFVKGRTSLEMNIGLFRHFVAFLHLRKNKDDIETVRRLLSHVYSETTFTQYDLFRKQHSFDALDRVIRGQNEENNHD